MEMYKTYTTIDEIRLKNRNIFVRFLNSWEFYIVLTGWLVFERSGAARAGDKVSLEVAPPSGWSEVERFESIEWRFMAGCWLPSWTSLV